MRGADHVARALEQAGAQVLFALSGNHIMPIFDAVLETGIRIVHARHEAAAVHMADAWGRLTGECGFVLVTGGPGHSNAVSGLYTARAAEAPLVLLSGHAAAGELGRGAFQEMAQVEIAEPLAKASWMATSARGLRDDIARAVRLATSGRPGPVHVSLPMDLLEAESDQGPAAPVAEERPVLSDMAERAVLEALGSAARPVILAGPLLCQPCAGDLLKRLSAALGVPAVGMESPRGLNDPSLGAFGEVLGQADLILLLGKPHDFTLRYAEPPFVNADCRFAAIDPDPAMIDRVVREKGARVVLTATAEIRSSAERLCARTASVGRDPAWHRKAMEAAAFRPPQWEEIASRRGEKLHPVELCRAVQAAIDSRPGTVLVCDGGEFGQWAQSLIRCPDRMVNGVAGAIGAAVPFAIGAAAAEPDRPVVAISGDGAFGFHMAEFDTAVRYGLPFVAVVGTDAAWNAEHQIQLRAYGPQRAHGCQLLPTRYDEVVRALGGHGEFVEAADEIAPALERAFSSRKPACVNVLIRQTAAPTIRRPTPSRA
ncbi:MAG TPA: thiamine pyrophosphate-binding protein [Beijerinckiaceae bacterium]|jgi:acetolactate synthase-1/2/3 large subunit